MLRECLGLPVVGVSESSQQIEAADRSTVGFIISTPDLVGHLGAELKFGLMDPEVQRVIHQQSATVGSAYSKPN